MRRILLGLVVLLVTGQAAAADPYNDNPYNNQGNPNYRYQAPSGMQYQYDLSQPQDQVRYAVDPSAQIRDSINVDPRRELDRDLGLMGGGAKR